MDIATMVSAPSMDLAALFSGPLTALIACGAALMAIRPRRGDRRDAQEARTEQQICTKSGASTTRLRDDRRAGKTRRMRQRVAEATYTGGHNIGLRQLGPPAVRRATSSR